MSNNKNLEFPEFLEIQDKVWKAFSVKNRRKILKLLCDTDLTQSILMEKLEISQPCVSIHIKTLTAAGLVDTKRNGQSVLCSLNHHRINEIQMGLIQLTKDAKFISVLNNKMKTSLKELNYDRQNAK